MMKRKVKFKCNNCGEEVNTHLDDATIIDEYNFNLRELVEKQQNEGHKKDN